MIWCPHNRPSGQCPDCDGIVEDSLRPPTTNLPRWCKAIRYRADDDVITLVVVIPTNDGRAYEVNLEALPENVRSLVDGLAEALIRSDSNRRVLDVPS